MSRKFNNLAGQRFGRLVAIHHTTTKNDNMQWLCKCDCGNETVVDNQSLKRGITKSCGCLAKEIRILKHTKHKLYGTRLNSIWNSMKQRCNNCNHMNFHNYGGRGIKVCDEWLDEENGFINFYNWAMQNGYSENLTLDRIDNDSNYEPNNCRWTNMKQQSNNRRDNHNITYNNETHTIAEWSEILNINRYTLYDRINRSNMSIEEALTKKVRKWRKNGSNN